MKYLLDVNTLVALGFANHEFHGRVASWLREQPSPTLMTCAITELGFIRVLVQAPSYEVTIAQARTLLARLKAAPRFAFLVDDHEASHLPAWVKAPKQITDGHLLELAKANGAALATLDERVPGAHLIPGR